MITRARLGRLLQGNGVVLRSLLLWSFAARLFQPSLSADDFEVLSVPAGGSEWRSGTVMMPWAQGSEDPAGFTLKGILLRSGDGWICWDTDLLRYSVVWTGNGLRNIEPPTSHRPWAVGARPWFRMEGHPIVSLRSEPGWEGGESRARAWGPLNPAEADYRGLSVMGSHFLLRYAIRGFEVQECPRVDAGEGGAVFLRQMRLGPTTESLGLVVCSLDEGEGLQSGGALTVARGAGVRSIVLGGRAAGVSGLRVQAGWEIVRGRRLVLRLPPLPRSTLFQIGVGSVSTARLEEALHTRQPDPWAFRKGGPAHWPERLETTVPPATATNVGETRLLPLPASNPWGQPLRVSGFDFFPGGGRAAVCTLEGDVWTVTLASKAGEKMVWQRYAAGLHFPKGIAVRDGDVFVLGQDQITRLRDVNGDGEADVYDAYNHALELTPNRWEHASDLQDDGAGGLVFVKAAPLQGKSFFDPVAAHSGSVLSVDRAGRRLSVIADGFLAPGGLAVGRKGRLLCTDNPGPWIPAARLNEVRKGGFYGCLATRHAPDRARTFDAPITWVPPGLTARLGGVAWLDRTVLNAESEGWIGVGGDDGSLWRWTVGGRGAWGERLGTGFPNGSVRVRKEGTGVSVIASTEGKEAAGADSKWVQVSIDTSRTFRVHRAETRDRMIRLELRRRLDPSAAAERTRYRLMEWQFAWSAQPPDGMDPTTRRPVVKSTALGVSEVRSSRDGAVLELLLARPLAKGATWELEARLPLQEAGDRDLTMCGAIAP